MSPLDLLDWGAAALVVGVISFALFVMAWFAVEMVRGET